MLAHRLVSVAGPHLHALKPTCKKPQVFIDISWKRRQGEIYSIFRYLLRKYKMFQVCMLGSMESKYSFSQDKVWSIVQNVQNASVTEIFSGPLNSFHFTLNFI